MTTMKNKCFIAVWLMLCAAGATAQDELPGQSEYLFDDVMQLWRHTENAAGLTLDSARNRGYSAFDYNHHSGDYHRVQEGKQTNTLNFYSEQYMHIGKYLYGFGSFHFDNGRTKGRAWSDVMRTYNSNPFISGSSVFGSYDFQNFDFVAGVGSIDFNGWRYGMKLDYKVGDLSRLRDPRTRSRLLDYQLTPSVNKSFGKHSIGLSAWYHRYKEKIPGIVTVQNNPNLYYYLMSGLETATGTIGGYNGYSREYVNHEFGGELQYAFQSEGYTTLNAVSLARGSEDMFEQYEREAGHYYTYIYKVQSRHRIHKDGRIHQFDFNLDFEQAYADEYRPQLVVTLDANTGYSSYRYDNLFTYKKRYQLERLTSNLSYRLNFTQGAAITRYAQLHGTFTDISQKHLLPTSTFDWRTLKLQAEYGQSFFRSRCCWLSVNAGYMLSSQAYLRLADTNTAYAQSVLWADQTYYESNYFTAGMSVLYQHPFTFKGYRFMGYVKGYYQTWRAQNSLEANTLGISIGIFN